MVFALNLEGAVFGEFGGPGAKPWILTPEVLEMLREPTARWNANAYTGADFIL